MTPGAWLTGDFVGDVERVPLGSAHLADGVTTRRLKLLSGHLRAVRRSDREPPESDGNSLRQPELGPVFVHLEGGDPDAPYQCVLRDVRVSAWSTFEPGQLDERGFGRVRGRFVGRIGFTDEIAQVTFLPPEEPIPTTFPEQLPEPANTFRPAGCALLSALGLSWSLVLVSIAVLLPTLLVAALGAALLLGIVWILFRLATGAPILAVPAGKAAVKAFVAPFVLSAMTVAGGTVPSLRRLLVEEVATAFVPSITLRSARPPSTGAIPPVLTVQQAAANPAAFLDGSGRRLALAGDVLFGVDDHRLTAAAIAELSIVADLLQRVPDRAFRIDGHADLSGDPTHNRELSLRRSEAVRNWLVQEGHLNPDRIRVRGLGSTAPLDRDPSPARQARNRRVELAVE